MITPIIPSTADNPLDWLTASLNEWSRFLSIAQELRDIDRECMETMLEARMAGPDPLPPEEATKVRSLIEMLKSLELDPDVIRLKQPETMRKLEAACIVCTKRDRCDHELAAGTAADAYREFCPNAPRLNALQSVLGAAPLGEVPRRATRTQGDGL